MVAWLAQNYAAASPIIVGAALVAALVSALCLVVREAYAHSHR